MFILKTPVVLSVFFLSVVLLLNGNTKDLEIIPDAYVPRPDHLGYSEILRSVGLDNTALGKTWDEKAKKSIENPLKIILPYVEDVYVDPGSPDSRGYRFSVKKGQRIAIDLMAEVEDSVRVFMDLFRYRPAKEGGSLHIASSARDEYSLVFEPARKAEYILRVQPEILGGGQFRLLIRYEPVLAFPVLGKDQEAIGSYFGVSREGGKRKHQGVDIFAAKNTPIIAPTNGLIRRTGNKGLGGKAIWMYDNNRDQVLYFAHLDEIYVRRGDHVLRGDTIGTVGNTGNARHTPAHLHFGIYESHALNPYHYIAHGNRKPHEIRGDRRLMGSWVRAVQSTRLKFDGGSIRKSNIPVSEHQLMRVIGATSASYRVQLPDGETGYVYYKDVIRADEPVKSERLVENLRLLESPVQKAMNKAELLAGSEIDILGAHEDFLYVQGDNGSTGWILAP